MPTSPNYNLTLTGYVEELTSPTYQLSATLFTSTLTSPTYWTNADEFFDKISSPVYQLTLDAPSYKLRGAQFADNTVTADRFQLPIGQLISTTSSVDLTSTGTTLLYTVPTGETVITTGVVLVATAGTATTDASVQIGSNAGNDNIFSDTSMIAFRDAQDVYTFWSTDVIVAATQTETINLEATVAATGTLTADIYLIGFTL